MYKICLECKKREEDCRCKEPIFETVFEHGPQGIPPLDEDQWKAIVKEMNKPPTPEKIAHFKKCRKIFDETAKRSRKGKILVYYGEIIKTADEKFWVYDNIHKQWIEVTKPNKDVKYIPVSACY